LGAFGESFAKKLKNQGLWKPLKKGALEAAEKGSLGWNLAAPLGAALKTRTLIALDAIKEGLLARGPSRGRFGGFPT
jgi:hypothetical protein